MAFVMRYEVTEHVPEPETKEGGKIKWDGDAPQVFGGNMPKDIVEGVAMTLENPDRLLSILLLRPGTKRSSGLEFEYGAVRPGHDLLINPIPQQAAAIQIGRIVWSQGDTRQDLPAIEIHAKIEMPEDLDDAPLAGTGTVLQLFIGETQKGERAGF